MLIHVCLVLKNWQGNAARWVSRPKLLGAERFQFARLVFRLLGTDQVASVCVVNVVNRIALKETFIFGENFLVAMIYAFISQECGSEKSMTVLIESANECLKTTASFIEIIISCPKWSHPEKTSSKANVIENHFGNERLVTHLHIPEFSKVPSRIFRIFTRH